ncbi:MAG: hypothetical protein JNL96_28850 [Planctomycetaceae bacterium]|nr:hypothetical protein [Planctomycetaceae bacterium]
MVALLCVPASADAQAKRIYRHTDPSGSEPERTTHDPGWWQRTFVGVDANLDGKFTDGERGILIIAYDAIASVFQGVQDWIMSALWAVIPEDLIEDMTDLAGYFRIANLWFPLDYCFGLLVIYYGFLGGLLFVKMMVSLWELIPFN